jgi:predicted RNase H-like nuclease (RuvC/YqgF family)
MATVSSSVKSRGEKQLCLDVDEEAYSVWEGLDEGEKARISNIAKKALTNIAMVKSIEILTGLDIAKLVDAVSIISKGYEVCKEDLDRCRRELEEARSESAEAVHRKEAEIERLRTRVEELEKSRDALMRKLSEYEAKLSRYAAIDVGKLRLFVCALTTDPNVGDYVKSLMEKYRIDYKKLCSE